MARKTKELTAKRVELLKTPGRYHDPQHRGLHLQIGPTGTKSWLLRYELDGRERWHGLGSVRDFTLKEARERARQARQLLADGRDPIEVKLAGKDLAAKEARERLTFREATDEFLKLHGPGWKNTKHRAQWRSTLSQYAFPKLGNRAVSSIDNALINDAVQQIWTSTPETARRVRGRIERIVAWVRDGRPLPGSVQNGRRSHPALPWGEIPQFMAELRQRQSVSARALEFLILTAARTGEAIGAQWDELDLEAKIWTIPAERMKGGREHRVPLSSPALELLRNLPHEGGPGTPVFAGANGGGKPLSNMAMLELLRGLRSGLTVHGFRSTFTDWAHETTNTPRTVVEMSLAHAISNKTEAAYRRGDLLAKRRRLMADWAKFCSSQPAELVSIADRRKARRP